MYAAYVWGCFGFSKWVAVFGSEGYQAGEKRLKDREERKLGDLRTYCRTVTPLKKTTEIQEETARPYP